MRLNFYLQRRLSSEDKIYTEAELLEASNYVVVLAEPGGGKTELLNSLARKLNTSVLTANKFVHVGTSKENKPLVIDAFDELAKIDASGIHKVLAKIIGVNPSHVIISSRSSEWDGSATSTFQEFLDHQPLVVRLCEFNNSEQQAIFKNDKPEEDFTAFHSEVSRFNLEALLPNPQFLKMFVAAYIESGRHFTDKHSIFKQAVEHLAKEVNKTIKNGGSTLPTNQKMDISSEIFAKLLLSGCEGVSINEVVEDRIYPLLSSLTNMDNPVFCILATRLFKLGDNSDQHRPVHKIVVEFSAAEYVTKRIADPIDPLTLDQCLPIIASNSTVRDELRGLLGWMDFEFRRYLVEGLMPLQ